MLKTRFSLCRTAALGCAAAVFVGTVSHASGQAPVAKAVETVAPATAAADLVLAEVTFHPRENLEVTYTFYGSAPLESKVTGQHIRLVASEKGMRDVLLDDGQTIRREGSGTQSVTINTGKHKTVAQLSATVAGYFQHFLQGPLAPNQDLGKVGDAKYGGELHFVAESPAVLRFDFLPVTVSPEAPIRFKRADVERFLGLLRK